MIAALKKSWKEISHGEPGKRFQARYRQKRKSSGKGKRPFVLGAAIVLIVAGAALLFVPGPGSVLIVIGAAFLAEESLIAARVLDRAEVQLRKLIASASATWKRMSTVGRAFLVTTCATLVAGAGWFAYSLFFR